MEAKVEKGKMYIISAENDREEGILITLVTDEDATGAFRKRIFDGANTALLRKKLLDKLGKETEWDCKPDLSDCIRVNAECCMAATVPHYHFSWDPAKKKAVKSKDANVVRKIRTCWLTNVDSLESIVASYVARIPENCLLDEDTADAEQ